MITRRAETPKLAMFQSLIFLPPLPQLTLEDPHHEDVVPEPKFENEFVNSSTASSEADHQSEPRFASEFMKSS